ncbi:hypothetical protein [Okeania sp. SIO2B3]|uniref:hypothetical protein n=1 Tax=Okeania sp. SIO2B3 TaxID=2607784 RepID=UPI0013C1E5A2|nr:hypothetical protein [Okeania sp. SIO2B3]NET45171.1 hypothetical protein [Okeania sp. SIO2B3]
MTSTVNLKDIIASLPIFLELAIFKKLALSGKIEINDKNEFYQNLINIKLIISHSIFDSVFYGF